MNRAPARSPASTPARPRVLATAAVIALAGSIGAMGGFMPSDQTTGSSRTTAPGAAGTPAVPSAKASGTTTEPRTPRAARRPAQSSGEGRAPTRESSRELDATRVDALIEVAQDVSPEWAEWLRARRASDPESLRTAIAQNGRRLIALSVLREQSPDLYRMKVAEMRLQAETGDAAKRHREAVDAGRTAEAQALAQELRQKAREQVDLDLKTRAAELAALDQQVRALKEQLTRDTKGRTQRIDNLVDALTAGKVGDPMAPPPDGPAPKGRDGAAGGDGTSSAGSAAPDSRARPADASGASSAPPRPSEPGR